MSTIFERLLTVNRIQKGESMYIFETENAPGFDVLQDGEVISLSNKGSYMEMDRDQLLALFVIARNWAEKGEVIH